MKKPLDDYHDALDMVDGIGRQLATLADAFDTVHQHSLAGQLTGMAADLYQAREAISKAFGDQLSARVADSQIHTSTMLATILHIGNAVKRDMGATEAAAAQEND